MIVILLVVLLSPAIVTGYEQVWETNFPVENGYGYDGNELYLPTNEWSLDLKGISLEEDTTTDWFKIIDGVLESKDLDCSSQLETTGVGVLWKSKIIELDSNETYLVDCSIETSSTWEDSSSSIGDFVKIGYYDDNQDFSLLYEKRGNSNQIKVSGQISNTTECQLIVEIDCSADNEVFKLRKVSLYSEPGLGNSTDLIITKLCSPQGLSYNERYIQITNIGNHLIDLSYFKIESIHINRTIFTWELNGIILPCESLVIGDQDATGFFCDIGNINWSSKSKYWSGDPTYNDGAQIVSLATREITDKVVGVNFYEGYASRKPAYLLASDDTNSEEWDFYPVASATDSNPGEFEFDDTLPISLTSTEFSWNDSGSLFSWITYSESNLIGYNIYFAVDSCLEHSLKINSHIISAQNSIQYNHYSFPLTELDSDGYLWLEVVTLEHSSSYSEAISFIHPSEDLSEVIEVPKLPLVTVFPNPTTRDSFIKIKNQESPIQEISVFNIKGQLVGKIEPKYTSDIYDISSITDHLSSGIYFVSTKFNTKSVIQKLLLTK